MREIFAEHAADFLGVRPALWEMFEVADSINKEVPDEKILESIGVREIFYLKTGVNLLKCRENI